MSTKLIAIVASLALTGTTACVGDDTGDPRSEDVPRMMHDEVPLSALATSDLPEEDLPMDPENGGPEGCDLTTATEGACTVACFPQLLIEQHVPEGTCVVFECELRTGERLQAGGCNL